MSTGFVYLRPSSVVCCRMQGAYATSVPHAWTTLLGWSVEAGFRNVLSRGYGLVHDNPHIVAADQCRYDACIELPAEYEGPVPESLVRRRLPGGAYARRRYRGEADGVGAAFRAMRDDWAPSNGLACDPARPFVVIYLADPAKDPHGALRTELCVPVIVADRALKGHADLTSAA